MVLRNYFGMAVQIVNYNKVNFVKLSLGFQLKVGKKCSDSLCLLPDQVKVVSLHMKHYGFIHPILIDRVKWDQLRI